MSASAQATKLKGSARLGTYLRRLRAGYGYSLRRVEEKARAEGGEIDNSQLSRYEKGVCYPSFDKLRVLASVFNVSIQSFSDVVDLEALEDLKPDVGEPLEMIEDGMSALRAGDTHLAFALFERATEILEERGRADRDLIARARINQAAALMRMGKLALAEQLLRTTLRTGNGTLTVETFAKALLALAGVHTEQGDFAMAELEAERAHDIAEREELSSLGVRALHSLGFVLASAGEHVEAINRYREALRRYEELGETQEALRIRTNVATCYVAMGKYREGIRMLRSILQDARAGANRRLEARTWTSLAEAYVQLGDEPRARRCIRESNTLLGNGNIAHADLLFANSYHDWCLARVADNPTREKIAFGRLKTLRSHVEKRFPEVEAFDAFVERGRNHA